MHILIAEDDTALASFVKKGLEAEHYAVDVSADGEQARAMASELEFDLVVLDLNMPRLDGVSILRFYARRSPACRSWCSRGGAGWKTGCSAWIWVPTIT